MKIEALKGKNPQELRRVFRAGEWTESTGGLATKYLQANLVVLSSNLADDFLKFCQANPKPCPLVDVSEPGGTEFSSTPGSNFYTDLPKYRVIEAGEPKESPVDIETYYSEGSVGFLLGCSVTFERALVAAGVPVRHLAAGTTAPMYITSMDCVPIGPLNGPKVVTMRAIPEHLIDRAVEITAAMPEAHGAPIHIGDPREIGVDLSQPDYGDPPIVEKGDVPVFWGCGVTPQEVARASGIDMITHFPGAMFITDREMES